MAIKGLLRSHTEPSLLLMIVVIDEPLDLLFPDRRNEVF